MRLFRPEPAFRSGFSLSPDDRPSPRLSGGHCSRPASSTPREDRPQVRSARDSSLAPVCPGVGDLNAAARCPEFNPSIPVSPRISASPSGCRPLRIAAFDPIWCREARLPKHPDLPRLPATRTSAAVRGFGSAAASEAGCSSNLLEPLRFSSRSLSKVNQILKS